MLDMLLLCTPRLRGRRSSRPPGHQRGDDSPEQAPVYRRAIDAAAGQERYGSTGFTCRAAIGSSCRDTHGGYSRIKIFWDLRQYHGREDFIGWRDFDGIALMTSASRRR